MSLLVESIKLYNGRWYNLAAHEQRANLSRFEIFGVEEKLHIKKNIPIPPQYMHGLVKCRVVYDELIREVSFSPYTIRNINKVKLVFTDETIMYNHKYLVREQLDTLFDSKEDSDEILIVHNGCITDAYYYNTVFQRNNQFYTPAKPLLEGTQRAKLLQKHKLIKTDIYPEKLSNYQYLHLINAMTPLGTIQIPIQNIVY